MAALTKDQLADEISKLIPPNDYYQWVNPARRKPGWVPDRYDVRRLLLTRTRRDLLRLYGSMLR